MLDVKANCCFPVVSVLMTALMPASLKACPEEELTVNPAMAELIALARVVVSTTPVRFTESWACSVSAKPGPTKGNSVKPVGRTEPVLVVSAAIDCTLVVEELPISVVPSVPPSAWTPFRPSLLALTDELLRSI